MLDRTARVLLAEDMNDYRKILKGYLRGLGLENIAEARDGLRAWELFGVAVSEGNPFPLVLSDIRMPSMSGLELLRAIRTAPDGAGVTVILLTGEADEAAVHEAIRLGVNDYLVKPFNVEQLSAKLKRFVRLERI